MKQHPMDWKFYRMYANLPMGLRDSEIVAVVNDEPMTFNVIKLELDNKTKIGYQALQNMIDMEII